MHFHHPSGASEGQRAKGGVPAFQGLTVGDGMGDGGGWGARRRVGRWGMGKGSVVGFSK